MTDDVQCEAKTTAGKRCKKKVQAWKWRAGRVVALCTCHTRPYWPLYERDEQPNQTEPPTNQQKNDV